jgi:hypothetical protein
MQAAIAKPTNTITQTNETRSPHDSFPEMTAATAPSFCFARAGLEKSDRLTIAFPKVAVTLASPWIS